MDRNLGFPGLPTTIEERILDLHRDKRDLIDGVLRGTGNAAKLSTEELIALMNG